MKTRMTILLFMLLAGGSFSQTDKPVFTLGRHRIGGYVGLGARSASVFDEATSIGDVRVGVTLDGRWTIGLVAEGLYYDKKLTALVPDGTYHFYAGYQGLFIERMISLGKNTKLNLSWLMAQGLAYYQYDKEYRRDKVWSEEVIDAVNFNVNEPAVELQQRVAGRFWLGVTASYRWTSPVWLLETPEDVMAGFSGGINVKYAIY